VSGPYKVDRCGKWWAVVGVNRRHLFAYKAHAQKEADEFNAIHAAGFSACKRAVESVKPGPLATVASTLAAVAAAIRAKEAGNG